jgi:cytochrome c5
LRDPYQRFSASFMIALGSVMTVACGQVTLSDPDQSAAGQATPIAEPGTEDAPLNGLQVYNEICVSCHAPPGIGGAPALGDPLAWSTRIAQGMDTLIDHALHGYSGSTGIMPMKGGRIDLSDDEVIRAVEYMVERVAQ